MKLKYILNIFIVILFILSSFIFVNYILKERTLIETLQTQSRDMPFSFSMEDAFCEKYSKSGSNLENACNELTKDNCLSTSCCVWTSRQKCVAGNANGPLFNTNSQGKTIPFGYYLFESKCYGPKCPNNRVS